MNSDITKLRIFDIFKSQNEWHNPLGHEKFLDTFYKSRIKREILPKALASIDPSFALVLEGPRRVGKSDLMLSMIRELITQQKISPRQICYVNCSNSLIGTAEFLYSIQSYFEFLFEREFYEINDPLYIFIDEIFNVYDWERTLKAAIDLKRKYNFIVTGSSAFKFTFDGKQSLAGRFKILRVKPFSFYETINLRLINETDQEPYENIHSIKEQLRDVFNLRELFEKGKGPFVTHQRLLDIDSKVSDKTRKFLESNYKHYLLFGGYPAFIAQRNKDQNYFKDSVLDPVIYKDLSQSYGLNAASRPKMERVVYYLLSRNAHIFSLSELQEMAGEKYHVRAGDLLQALETSLLFDLITPMAENPKITRKGKRKVYFVDTGMIHQITGKLSGVGINIEDFFFQESFSEIKGYAAETALYQHLKRLRSDWEIYYLRNDKNNREYEIDFVWKTPFGYLPIECKMRHKQTLNEEIFRLKSLMTQKMKAGLIITANDLKLADNILCCPHYYFLGTENLFGDENV